MKYDLEQINRSRKRRGLDLLPVRGRGRPAIGPKPSGPEIVDLYQRWSLSIRAAAKILGTSKDAVWRALDEHGITARPTANPSRLAVYGPVELRRRIKADGLRATARALGLDPKTLTDYLRRHGAKK